MKRHEKVDAGTTVLLISNDYFRPDRDGYVKIVMGNVKAGRVSNFFGKKRFGKSLKCPQSDDKVIFWKKY